MNLSKLSLNWRIFALTAALLILAIGAATTVTVIIGQQTAHDSARSALVSSVAVQDAFEDARAQQLLAMTDLLALNSEFVSYIAAATEGSELGFGGGVDVRSIRDLLLERQSDLGFDVAVVLDADGELIYRSDRNEFVSESLADGPLVGPALDTLSPAVGIWSGADAHFQMAIAPLARGDYLIGFVMLGLAIDEEFARQIAQVGNTDVVFTQLQAETADRDPSTLGAAAWSALLPTIATLELPTANEPVIHRFKQGSINWLVEIESLSTQLYGVSLKSLDEAAAGFSRIITATLIAGIVALLIGLLASAAFARQALKPVRLLAVAAKRAAEGDYDQRFERDSGDDDLGQLTDAFDLLLSDLRQKIQMEEYVSDLSRHLPDPAVEEATATRTRSGGLTRTRPGAMGDIAGVLILINAPHLATALAAGRQPAGLRQLMRDAVWASLDGRRMRWLFSGSDRFWPLLQTTAAALQELGEAASAVVVSGKFTLHDLDGEPLVEGDRLVIAEALANDAPKQSILLSPEAKEILVTQFDTEIARKLLTVVSGARSGKRRLAANTDAVLAQPRTLNGDAETAQAPTAVASSAPAAARRRRLQPGQLFGERFEILSVLGTGGMGVVYKARDLELQDLVALKTLRSAASNDPVHLERMKSEIKLARRITHPNILRTFDFGVVDDTPFISMEYVRGLTLRYLLKQRSRLPIAAGLRVSRQLADGLAAAHEQGVIHRDIKPENLIIEQSGNVKLMDFGIARPVKRTETGNTAPGSFVGTPHYAAPEQMRGDEPDERSDVYACGIVIMETFCGNLPYTEKNTVELYQQMVSQAPNLPSAYWPEIPQDLEVLILRCIEMEPNARFDDAQALSGALTSLRV